MNFITGCSLLSPVFVELLLFISLGVAVDTIGIANRRKVLDLEKTAFDSCFVYGTFESLACAVMAF